jgi:glyoxylase-like metal-dependent hydrolase (beta-lactamase superfamily II)
MLRRSVEMMRARLLLSVVSATLLLNATVRASDTEPPQAQSVAPGVWLIPGGIRPGREPDGNTVVFSAPAGLVVMDTGRHDWHRQAILDFARAMDKPIAAIVNSHWHLDHVSGNPAIRAAYPDLTVYASNAIDDALAGFLAKSVAAAQPHLDSGKLPTETAEDLRGDIATIRNGAALRPDVVIASSRVRTIAGRKLEVNLAPNAATAGDVWVYDPEVRVAAVGDLVTLPAPFLDTACPAGWSTALARIARTPFRIAIPGHGGPLTLAQFATYRTAFDALITCAATIRDAAVCAAAWTGAVAGLPGSEAARGQAMAFYYVKDVLRAHGGKSGECRA